MLEITSQHIAQLADDDLRSLVGLLCESQLRKLGLPASAVTLGGKQEAADGGLDVRVFLPAKTKIVGFVPRPNTGFQVKKTEMPPSKILKEMKPRNSVRPSIRELAKHKGAYIIVSSADSTSDSALLKRRKAMRAAIRGVSRSNTVLLDFYDQSRLSTWLREHPGLILWVRDKIGMPIQGWRSYGAWAYPADGPTAEYLIDQSIRIQTGKHDDGSGLKVLEGIKRIRDVLRVPRTAVRLVGLSGVGKTRLVQALFDERIGDQALDLSLAFYTNMSDDPLPQPVGFVSGLIAEGTRAVLIVDNCPQDLHRRISELCKAPESRVSVVTVEYDIREDVPEGTEVFELQPSSIDLVETLVKSRFDPVSPIDARTIAESSGGNSKVAIALASTIGKGDSIAGLKDDELFNRLFRQKHPHDKSLFMAAQACSLVYSFDGEHISATDAELPRIAALVGQSADELFGHVAELRRRELVQQRGVWRAVLPHAIANRLAVLGLQNIPRETIEQQLTTERLLRSFSRRLGFLHDSKEAVGIAEDWLAPGGMLIDVRRLNELGKAILSNIAPVAPQAVLAALERALIGSDADQIASHVDYVRLLRSLAYDPDLFDQSAKLLIELSDAEEDSNRDHETSNALVSLFHIYLSGTHAPIEQRLRVIKQLLESDNLKRQELGLRALDAALEATHFMSAYSFDFGARSRDYGYRPRTTADVVHWYSSVLKLVEALAHSDRPIATRAALMLAHNFRGLWTSAGMYGDLDRLSRSIASTRPWRDGWIAVRETLAYDSEKFASDVQSQLSALEKFLRPITLVQKVRYIVLSTKAGSIDLSDDDADLLGDVASKFKRRQEIAEALGSETSNDEHAFAELLPDLVSIEGQLFPFGRGLAVGSRDPMPTWQALIAQLATTPERERNLNVLRGFLSALIERDKDLANALLDDALKNSVLAYSFPILQTIVPIDAKGIVRLKHSIAANNAPIWMFRNIAWGRSSDSIPGAELRALLQLIAAKSRGYGVAADILAMRLYADKSDKRPYDSDVLESGKELLRRLTLRGSDVDDVDSDYNLGEIATACLTGSDGASIAQDVCHQLKSAISTHETHAYKNLHFLAGLLKAQPTSSLDALLTGSELERSRGIQVIEAIGQHHPNPVNEVPESKLFEWCEQDSAMNYPMLASVINPFHRSEEKAPLHWAQLALRILERAPDRVAVLKRLVSHFRPMSWSGSRAAIMEERAQLLEQFNKHADPMVVEFVASEQVRLKQEIEQEKRIEAEYDRRHDERFE